MRAYVFSMSLFALTCMLLCAAWMDVTVCCCMLENYTFWTEIHDCDQCVAINTTMCSGYCYTQDTNLNGRFGRTFLIQRGCMPHSLVYRAARVPGCPNNANPLFYYPEAHRCQCRRCDTRTHQCVHTTRTSAGRCPTGARETKIKAQDRGSMP
uniref:Gonadotropin subunit beta-2 n=1 Tax=Myripristis murdjan TaxID=586833 RepID=A0A667WH13_9TELE